MTDVATPDMVERSLSRLDSDQQAAFLAALVFELTLANRALYPPPGTEAYQEVGGFICHNELLHAVANQLRAKVGGHGQGFANEALVETLVGTARAWGCDASLRSALVRALASSGAAR